MKTKFKQFNEKKMKSKEVWKKLEYSNKDVYNILDIYVISNNGRIMDYETIDKDTPIKWNPKYSVSIYRQNQGNSVVLKRLNKNNEIIQNFYSVDELVYENFVGIKPIFLPDKEGDKRLTYVYHIDGDIYNDDVLNLEIKPIGE